MEDDLKILKSKYLSNHWPDISQILNLSSGDQTKIKNTLNENDLQWKMTSSGRWPQNVKSWISQYPVIFVKFELKLREANQKQKGLKQRWPPMEDDLKKMDWNWPRWKNIQKHIQLTNHAFLLKF